MAATTTTGNVTWLPASAGRARTLRRVLPTLGEMWRAAMTRRALAQMDDRMLADIGVGRGDALVEANRRFWDLGTP